VTTVGDVVVRMGVMASRLRGSELGVDDGDALAELCERLLTMGAVRREWCFT